MGSKYGFAVGGGIPVWMRQGKWQFLDCRYPLMARLIELESVVRTHGAGCRKDRQCRSSELFMVGVSEATAM